MLFTAVAVQRNAACKLCGVALDIPVWRRYTLTIEEAAGYYHIGEGKLRMLIDEHPNEDFYVMNGNRALIKREKFEIYLDQATAV